MYLAVMAGTFMKWVYIAAAAVYVYIAYNLP